MIDLCQPLYVGVQVSGRDLGVPTGHSLEQCVVDEDVLVLRLNHVVPLGAHQRHMAVDVNGLFMLDSLRHGVNDNEAACAAHSGADGGKIEIFQAGYKLLNEYFKPGRMYNFPKNLTYWA